MFVHAVYHMSWSICMCTCKCDLTPVLEKTDVEVVVISLYDYISLLKFTCCFQFVEW